MQTHAQVAKKGKCTLQARKLPQTHAETVEFFLTTESEEMEYEVARCRPLLTEELFGYLQQQISASCLLSFFYGATDFAVCFFTCLCSPPSSTYLPGCTM